MYSAEVVSRPNRFLVNVASCGQELACHLHDPGRLEELIYPGNKVIYRQTNGKKTSYSITAALSGNEWVLTDTRIHSEMASKFLPVEVEPEVRLGNHRIDFRWNNYLIEVKGCTLLKGSVAKFPDAPTKRGREHLRMLREHVQNGGSSLLLILVLREGAYCFIPNSDTDPDFSSEFEEAIDVGVEYFIPKLKYDNGAVQFLGKVGLCQMS